MRIITSFEELQTAPLEPSAAALGTFDGLHLGHQRVISTCNRYAETHGLSKMVFTFSSHPLATLMPELEPKRLLINGDKEIIMRRLGVNVLINIPFTKSLSQMSADDFLQLLKNLGVRAVSIGMNFSFGSGGRGNVQYLNMQGGKYGLKILSCPLLKMDGLIVSSTQIRKAIKEGDVALARKMLGRPYVMQGKVVPGYQRGRKMGFPTANLDLTGTKMAVPADGVYEGESVVDGRRYKVMVNIGKNPTFALEKVTLEAHIIGFHGDLYGDYLRVALLRKIRDEHQFASAEELMEQLKKDRETILSGE
ncbi:MAG: bifunctional riboflavin kinase/FAD synthetase [Acidaminococcus sp.]|jgi:riboflavin kinase/FMN adenylyltransferase|nr:bifunctional riboflavin kinase/FAD synthetase [Acidaminococcus sp.]MCI2099979.1 bifunctional riboflavin kinase/FAD synthetase [Acidaminococcus sp.]MCI2114255.1 bifunctional riboflavin kinase/FAD synthetase [Acidaminococcus sp.]MCI2116231.1 bifunctional riboflavin kinase/FAD synthetase [Acidaminococcus sp.]